MSSKAFRLLAATLIALPIAQYAHGGITLASWTFDNAYTTQAIDDTHKLYTPTADPIENGSAVWFSAETPVILPNSSAETAKNSTLTPTSVGRYWQLCNGYNNSVLRIENSDEISVSDWSDASQHKVFYELSFPTKGYKGITVEYALAAGNNTATPIKAVVSTDGGKTWIDAGSHETAPTWWTYNPQTVSISANNKDNVLVRLMPSVGKTNWNLDYVTVSAEEQVQSGAVNIKDVTLTWELDKGTANPSGAEISAAEVFSYAELAIGEGLVTEGVSSQPQTIGDKIQTKFQPTANNAQSPDPSAALKFTVKAKKGLKFTPKTISFNATKYGTGGGAIDVDVICNGQTAKLATAECPARNNETPPYTEYKLDITNGTPTGDEVTAYIYIYKLANNKQYGIGDVVITGDVEGEIEQVPVYTFSLTSAMPEAGSLSCSPGGAEFDEGTVLTVAASENFGYHFTNWTDAEGKVVSSANPYVFEIRENTSLTANFTANNVYAINLNLTGGANPNLVTFTPTGKIIDGIHHYEEGTEVKLATINNRILTFTNWEDNSTAPTRDIIMDGVKNLTANFSAADYIVGWDFYNDQPSSERAADYKAESDNAGLLSLRNAEGKTTSWLTRGINNGAENGKWGARVWKLRSEGNYFEASFSTVGYTNIIVSAALGISYNSYSVNNMQYSIDGVEYKTVGTYNLQSGWTSNEFTLPEDANNQPRIWVRFMPDTSSPLVGADTDYDGLCIAELFVLADREAANDNVAPVLVTAIPANGSTDISATGSIILTFDEKVKAGTGSATLDSEVLTPIESGKSIIYNYSGLDYGKTYTFTVPAGAVTDRSSNAFAGTTLSFTTMERVQPEARLFDAVVAKDGSGNYTSVQAAIDAAPAGRVKPWLIFVKNGEYKEHIDIPKTKPFMHIIGQDRDKAIILDDQLCGGDNAVHVSVGATVVINSDDCFFENITLENSYGHEKQSGPQALALNTSGDRAIFNNVAMLSYQDTWITTSTSSYRAYVRNSFIEGAVDFIYNSGDLYVENTTLYINRKSGGFIVAPSHAADVKWGYVFNNCTITAPGVPSETDVWLGRPWHNYPKTVFLNTRAEVTIPATGWYETMGGLPALWADYNTVDGNGNPVDLSQRRDTYYKIVDGEKVYGKAKNFLTDEEAAQYTVRNVLSGTDAWQPVIKTESCATPAPVFKNGVITWDAVPYAICYVVLRNDEVIDFVTEPTYTIADSTANGYAIRAVNEFGGLSPKANVTDGNESGIVSPVIDGETVVGIFDIRGIRHEAPVEGMNIIKKRDNSGNIRVEKLIL